MKRRNIFAALVLLATSASLLAATAPTAPSQAYPAGTIFSGGLAWLKPDANSRLQADAASFCASSSAAGVSGWHLPTELELSNLYYDKAAQITAYGWNTNWLWTSEPYINWGRVVRLSDGTWSYTNDPLPNTCVRNLDPLPAGTFTDNGLQFLKPDGIARNWTNAVAYCAANSTNGLTGWRVPTEFELSNLYYNKGSTALSAAGWALSWVWTTDPQYSGHYVVRMSDGLPSYDTSGLQAVSCVREIDALAATTVVQGGLSWMKPAGIAKNWTDANNSCNSSSYANLSGWRLPTQLELASLVYEKGSAWFSASNWPSDWTWTSTVYSNGHKVIRLSDAAYSYGISDVLQFACVRPAFPAAPTTITAANLVWSKPAALARPYGNANAYCANETIAGNTAWRLPTLAELQVLYAQQGSQNLTQSGWANGWLWSSTVYSSGYEVVRMSDGMVSWDIDTDASRQLVSCVHDLDNSGNISSGGLTWSQPAAMLRPWYNTENYCSSAQLGNQSGWRLPSKAELLALYADKGGSYLAANGWPANWVWSFSPYSTGFSVMRSTDGLSSWAGPADANRYLISCVRDAAANPAGSFTQNGLVWARPAQAKRPWASSANYCSEAVIAGKTGWRMPTLSEISGMYTQKGVTALTQLGWPTDWIWTSTPYSSGYQVFRFSDGLTSWSPLVDTERQYLACVHTM